MMQQDDAVHAHTAPNSSLVLQIDKGVGRQFLLIIWFGIFGLVLGSLGFAFGVIALVNTSAITSLAGDAARAAAKAETATARANVAEIYAKQLFTEMNRLGYPIRTPAEEHDPQPPETAIPENPQ